MFQFKRELAQLSHRACAGPHPRRQPVEAPVILPPHQRLALGLWAVLFPWHSKRPATQHCHFHSISPVANYAKRLLIFCHSYIFLKYLFNSCAHFLLAFFIIVFKKPHNLSASPVPVICVSPSVWLAFAR